MIKNDLNAALRQYVSNHLSPTLGDQKLVSSIYESIAEITGSQQLLQIGSYPRYTSVKPLHDLDILWILGKWNKLLHDPKEALEAVEAKIENEYMAPDELKIHVSLQTHSVTISYFNSQGEELFSVDIVPAYIFSKNEYQEETYKVPELLHIRHKSRQEYYKGLEAIKKEMQWISSDPKGYIHVSSELNSSNEDFRRTVKFVKAWKNALCDKDSTLKLKSFHLEQVITKYFIENRKIEIFDAIFKYFCDFPDIIEAPQIPDRANREIMIDEYLNDISNIQKEKMTSARDCILIKLENFTNFLSIPQLLEICFHSRIISEKYLFDSKIPTLIDNGLEFSIDGFVKRKNGFRNFMYKISHGFGDIDTRNSIQFRIFKNTTHADYYKWKVKNDDSCEEPRGEITDHQTKNDPESTKYIGNHYVECYAIKNNMCIAKAKQNVIIVTAQPKFY